VSESTPFPGGTAVKSDDMTITVERDGDRLRLSTVYNGRPIWHLYKGYTPKRAKREFKRHVLKEFGK
jgi:hypothetical protein